MFKRRHESDEDTQPLDPVAMTLAIWLALVVGVTGLTRLAEAAVEAHAASVPPNALARAQARMMMYGG